MALGGNSARYPRLKHRYRSPTSSPQHSQDDEDDSSPVARIFSAPRLLDFGSPSRIGGTGLCTITSSKTEYDVARFFTARDILDLINQLHKSAQIALDEANDVQGKEQANRVKAKCSKICGLSNRLIDLYVATIKAKVARILRKLGLGQAKGQELLYHHLTLLQGLVDQAFACFNAVQYAEAMRIRQSKNTDSHLDSPWVAAWRSPAERKPHGRQGSQGSGPQPAQQQDVKELLLEARRKFSSMAGELTELKNTLITLDRARIQEAVAEAIEEGEVSDPLPKLKPTANSMAYGFHSRHSSDSGWSSAGTLDSRSSCLQSPLRSPRGSPNSTPTRSAHRPSNGITTPPTCRARTSRLVRSSLETSLRGSPGVPRAVEQLRPSAPYSMELRSASEPGDSPATAERDAWISSALSGELPRSGNSRKARAVISDTGQAMHAEYQPSSRGQDVLSPEPPEEATGWDDQTEPYSTPVAVDLRLGVSSPSRACSLQPWLWSAEGGPQAITGNRSGTTARHQDPAQTLARLQLELQAAKVGGHLVHPDHEEGKHEMLRDLALEALRLIERDPDRLDEALGTLQLCRGQLDEAAARCRMHEPSATELQETIQTCLKLLGHQLRQHPQPSDSPTVSPADAASTSTSGGGTPQKQFCTRCEELGSFLDDLLPLLNSPARGARPVTSDSIPIPTLHGVPEIASDGSQDEIMLMPIAADCEASVAGSDAVVMVLHRLTIVLERFRRAQEDKVEVELRLEEERREREAAEAKAVQLQEDHDAASAALVSAQQRLADTERHVEQLRTEVVGVTHELECKSAEVESLRHQLLETDNSNRSLSSAHNTSLLDTDEVELEGLRMENQHLREETQLQVTERRHLKQANHQLQASRDKLAEELQDLNGRLHKYEEAKAVDISLVATAKSRKGASTATSPGKAAARGASRGVPAAVGGSFAAQGRRGIPLGPVDMPTSRMRTRGVGAGSGVGVTTAPGTLPSRTGSEISSSMMSLSSMPKSPVANSSKRSGIPLPLCVSIANSGASSPASTPHEKDYITLARLEEIQVHLAQTEAARETLEHQLKAAQVLLSSKDSELTTANLMLQEFDRLGKAVQIVPSLEAVSILDATFAASAEGAEFQDPTHAGRDFCGDAVAVVAINPSASTAATLSTSVKSAATQREKLHDECQELTRRANELDQQRAAAITIADDRAHELEAMRLYIQQLEESVQLLEETSSSASQQMMAKEHELAGHEEALQEARCALECARANYEEQGKLLSEKEVLLLGAQVRLAEVQALSAEMDKQHRCDAEAMALLHGEVESLQAQLLAAQKSLEVSSGELATARMAADAVELILADQQRSLEELRSEFATTEDSRAKLAMQVAATAASQDALKAELSISLENRQDLTERLDAALSKQEETALELAAVQAACEQVKSRLADSEENRQQLLTQLEEMGASKDGLQAAVATLHTERNSLQEQLANVTAAAQGLEVKLTAVNAVRQEAGEQLQAAESATKNLAAELRKAQASSSQLQLQLSDADENKVGVQGELAQCQALISVMAAQLTTTRAARDHAYDCVVRAEAAVRQHLECRLSEVEAKAQIQAAYGRGVEHKLQCALEDQFALMQETSSNASRHAAEAASVIDAVSGAKARLAAAYSAMETKASKVSELEDKLSHAAEEKELLVIEAATAAAYAEMLEKQLNHAKAQNAVLEKQLATAKDEYAQCMARSAAEADTLAEQLAAAHAVSVEQAARFNLESDGMSTALGAALASVSQQEQSSAALVAYLEAQLVAAHQTNHAQTRRFADEAAELALQLATARDTLAEQAKRTANATEDVEDQLVAAREEMAQLAVRHAANIAELEAKRSEAQSAAEEHAERASIYISELEDHLTTARQTLTKQTEHSESREAELTMALAVAQTELTAQARRSADQAEELEAQLAATRGAVAQFIGQSNVQVQGLVLELEAARLEGAANSKHAAEHVAQLEAELTDLRAKNAEAMQLAANRIGQLEAQLAENAQRGCRAEARCGELEKLLAEASTSSVENVVIAAAQAEELQDQLHAAREELTQQSKRAEVEAVAILHELQAARVKLEEKSRCSAAKIALLEAEVVAARSNAVQEANRSVAAVVQLEQQLNAARADIVQHVQLSATTIAALESQLHAARAEAALQDERAAARVAKMERKLAESQASIVQQACLLNARAAEVQAASEDLAARSAFLTSELESKLAALHVEKVREAEHFAAELAELQSQLSAARAESSKQAEISAALVLALQEQLLSARNESTKQNNHMLEIERELGRVVAAHSASKACQDLLMEAHADNTQWESQQLQCALMGLKRVLQERADNLVESDAQLGKVRQELATAVAVLQELQVTAERLQAATEAAIPTCAVAINAEDKDISVSAPSSAYGEMYVQRHRLYSCDASTQQPDEEPCLLRVGSTPALHRRCPSAELREGLSENALEECVLDMMATGVLTQQLDDAEESLVVRLAETDGEAGHSDARVAELMAQLQHAQMNVATAEKAAADADAERCRVEAQLVTVIAENADGRALVQRLSADIARYQDEVGRVRASLIAKQPLFDWLLANHMVKGTHAPVSLSKNVMLVPTEMADKDGDLAQDFLEGCRLGMDVSSQQHPVQEDFGVASHQCTTYNSIQAQYPQADFNNAWSLNLLELMSKKWHGMDRHGLRHLGLDSRGSGVVVTNVGAVNAPAI